MPLDLRLSPSRDAYPPSPGEADGQEAGLAEAWLRASVSAQPRAQSQLRRPSSKAMPEEAFQNGRCASGQGVFDRDGAVLGSFPASSAEAPGASPPSGGSAPETKVELPVLHSAIDLARMPPSVADHCFTAWLTEADTLVVPAHARLRGHFSAPCVHVKGVVHGSVTATRGPLIIDRGATVQGRVVSSGELVIAGHVRGRGPGPAVLARASLKLAGTARVRGEVRYTEVAIYMGARVDGVLLAVQT